MKNIILLILTISILSAACFNLDFYPKAKLEQLAIETEAFYRQTNGDKLVGEQYDYTTLSKERLIQEINNFLKNGGKETRLFVQNKVESEIVHKFPLKAFLYELSEYTLSNIVSDVQDLVRNEKDYEEETIAYSDSMTQKEIADAILTFTDNWGEYKSSVFYFAKKHSNSEAFRELDFVSNEYLISLAYALEKYYKKLSREGKIDEIKAAIATNDRNSILEAIKSIVSSISKIDSNFEKRMSNLDFHQELVNSQIIVQKEVTDLFKKKSNDEIIEIVLKVEKYIKRVNKNAKTDEDLLKNHLKSYIIENLNKIPLIANEKNFT